MGQIMAQEAVGSMRRNMPKFLPAVMLGRLAIDRKWQGKGIGRALLALDLVTLQKARPKQP
jgi:predicted N-acetyltransferase YhbS